MNECQIPGCDRPSTSTGGLCQTHHRRAQRGDTRTGIGKNPRASGPTLAEFTPPAPGPHDDDPDTTDHLWRAPLAVRQHGACAGQEPTMRVSDPRARYQHRGARAICAGCPVYRPCLAWVLTTPFDPSPFHVVAGLAPMERSQLAGRLLIETNVDKFTDDHAARAAAVLVVN